MQSKYAAVPLLQLSMYLCILVPRYLVPGLRS